MVHTVAAVRRGKTRTGVLDDKNPAFERVEPVAKPISSQDGLF